MTTESVMERDGILVAVSGAAALVTDNETSAALFIDGLLQSRLSLRNPATIMAPYLRWMSALTETCGASGAIAHIGGGLLALERRISAVDPGREQVVFELSADVVHLVTTYTPKLPPNVTLFNAPGEHMFHEGSGSNFGLTLIDAGAGERVPPALLTKDFHRSLAGTGGCFSINVVAPASGDVDEVLAVTKSLYGDVLCIYGDAQGESRSLGNVVVSGCNCGGASRVSDRLRRVQVVDAREWNRHRSYRSAATATSNAKQIARRRREDLLVSGTTTYDHPLMRWESNVVLAQLNELLDGTDARVTLGVGGV